MLNKYVEEGDIVKVFNKRSHPYTAQLIGSVPTIAEDVPTQIEATSAPLDLFNLPEGCAFIDRCPYGKPVCREVDPQPFVLSEDHRVFCHKYNNDPRYEKEALIRGEK